MPDPGPSSPKSSLPAAAAQFGAQFGAHGHGHGIGAVGSGPSALPVLPAPSAQTTPTDPVDPVDPSPVPEAPSWSVPVTGTVPVRAAEPAPVLVPAAPVAVGPESVVAVGELTAALVPEGAAALRTPLPDLERILRGPSGLGAAGLHLVRSGAAAAVPGVPEAVGNPVPGLYFHPVPEPDPVRVEEVSRRIKEWAVEEVELFPPDWEDQFDGFSLGRYMVACHPDAPTVDHLMIATRLMAAENAVDDVYCEDHGGSPVGLGGRLLLAHTALDPVHTTAEYQPQWAESLRSDAPRRAYGSAMQYFVQAASPSQADRFRHDMARLHLGYLAEAAWTETDYVPEVWEYLSMRQFNNFRPCPTITDTVGGYELPADLHAQPAVQRVIALAGNATTIVNDLYSYTKELASPGLHLNLPVVIAEREGCSVRDAFLKAVEVHNDLMHAFEAAAADVAAAFPVPSMLRFLRGVAVWVDGNHYWHQTNTYRYSLPDFW
ncbi:family 2 encapsulin nanocompartment cargo protein terpene cyclase [Streptomyces sp. NBC_00503]|uniref:family 2 encapsulin nanocompartment cargo protein terpene cyclase n=1 Tax=Streptomyces sp. NBC_00503 TaxID=2903659 RepID=UPI002E807475|nr:family 2 encapsulin nanocompartment cargo protein terpene cyclase [Streptomyces sp. NBC_00503]WUD79353.1 family 2 encapsulin nanocompartment cargo protein terpene cyclase [Streptomyces sp. NBC_00503]